jgi:hypothetical protein
MRNRTKDFSHALSMIVALGAGFVTVDVAAITVTNTNDSGAGSLRQAILDANKTWPTCAAQSITFAIPGAGVQTIRPTSALPAITASTTIDGYTQSDAAENTSYDGDNAVIRIELDGSLAGSSNGLTLLSVSPGTCSANASIIEGLAINRFALAGIEMVQAPTCTAGQCFPVGAYVVGSFIGTDPTGKVAHGNGVGLHFGLNSDGSVVGEQVLNGNTQTPAPGLRNIVSGNLSDGVLMDSSDSTKPSLGHSIRGNYIGVDVTGAHALANGRYGIFGDIGSSGAQIQNNIIAGHSVDGVRIMDGTDIGIASNAIGVGVGGVALGNGGDGIHVGTGVIGAFVNFGYPSLSANGIASIAYNAGAGLYVEGSSTVDVSAGSFGDNVGLGIDLAPRGPNPNDAGDGDSGPNELVNSPVLTSAVYAASMSPPATISGTLDTTPNSSNEVDFYVSAACDSSGYGEGEGYLGSVNSLTADSSGHATFSKALYAMQGMAVTALTRRFSDTPPPQTLIVSEFSNCKVVGDPIFTNGFEQ